VTEISIARTPIVLRVLREKRPMADDVQDWEMSLSWCGHAVVRVRAVDLREFPSARRMDGEWSL
jgi:hypothetical protein